MEEKGRGRGGEEERRRREGGGEGEGRRREGGGKEEGRGGGGGRSLTPFPAAYWRWSVGTLCLPKSSVWLHPFVAVPERSGEER